MNRLLLATRSADKAREIKQIMQAAGCTCELVSLADARVVEHSDEERIEEHDSFLGNARAKAEYFVKLTGLPTVADDSGLEVLSLLGKPVPRGVEAVVQEASIAAGAHPSAQLEFARHRADPKWTGNRELFEAYLAAVETTARFVNHLQLGAGS